MSLSLEGIGAQLQKQDDVVVIRDLIASGPAKTSGKFTPGDRIVGVGQGTSGPLEDVICRRLDALPETHQAPKGPQVRLHLFPAAMGLDAEPTRILLSPPMILPPKQAHKPATPTLPAQDRP